jgi:hypothetical protein
LTTLVNNMIRVTFWWYGICKSTVLWNNKCRIH